MHSDDSLARVSWHMVSDHEAFSLPFESRWPCGLFCPVECDRKDTELPLSPVSVPEGGGSRLCLFMAETISGGRETTQVPNSRLAEGPRQAMPEGI